MNSMDLAGFNGGSVDELIQLNEFYKGRSNGYEALFDKDGNEIISFDEKLISIILTTHDVAICKKMIGTYVEDYLGTRQPQGIYREGIYNLTSRQWILHPDSSNYKSIKGEIKYWAKENTYFWISDFYEYKNRFYAYALRKRQNTNKLQYFIINDLGKIVYKVPEGRKIKWNEEEKYFEVYVNENHSSISVKKIEF